MSTSNTTGTTPSHEHTGGVPQACPCSHDHTDLIPDTLEVGPFSTHAATLQYQISRVSSPLQQNTWWVQIPRFSHPISIATIRRAIGLHTKDMVGDILLNRDHGAIGFPARAFADVFAAALTSSGIYAQVQGDLPPDWQQVWDKYSTRYEGLGREFPAKDPFTDPIPTVKNIFLPQIARLEDRLRVHNLMFRTLAQRLLKVSPIEAEVAIEGRMTEECDRRYVVEDELEIVKEQLAQANERVAELEQVAKGGEIYRLEAARLTRGIECFRRACAEVLEDDIAEAVDSIMAIVLSGKNSEWLGIHGQEV